MNPIDLATVDRLLTTTRSVRKRLDLTRPVEPEIIERCIEIAFWSALHERSLEGAMRFLSEAGGDTAGNTATAGGLLGARDGEGAIPQTWLAKGDTPGIAALAEGLVSEA